MTRYTVVYDRYYPAYMLSRTNNMNQRYFKVDNTFESDLFVVEIKQFKTRREAIQTLKRLVPNAIRIAEDTFTGKHCE